jgi:uncharacterized protein (TIGR03435 family)
MRALAGLSLAVLFSFGASGQSAASKPTFDIADVHLSPHSTNTVMRASTLRTGRYEWRNATMLDLIRTAYNVDADTVVGGPSWLEYDRFDVIAKAPANTPQETVSLMLQSLLADRFKLVAHDDMKPMTAFALTPGKGKPKLKEADGSGTPGCQLQPPVPATPNSLPFTAYSCHNVTLAQFASQLRGFAGAYLTSPVLDSTGLKGSWDFDIKWTNAALRAVNNGSSIVTVFEAIDKELGLKLEEQKVPAPVIVVDSANEKPTANSSEVAAAFPPPPPLEFEVADVKPSAQPLTATQITVRAGFKPGGRVDLPRFPMRLWLSLAWNVNTSEEIIGLPKWAESANFDIIAKAPSTADLGTGLNLNNEEFVTMMRALLVDRFKMKAHLEDRPVNAYTLTAVKPKLKKADPASRTGCKSGQATPILVNNGGTLTAPPRAVTCQNVTMAQFAEQLPILAGNFVRYPPLDSTGLEGGWDFTFSFSPIQINAFIAPVGQRGDGPGLPGTGPGASDPSGAVTIYDAVEKQLGLKLEMQKRPFPVLVIDHLEEKPTDN